MTQPAVMSATSQGTCDCCLVNTLNVADVSVSHPLRLQVNSTSASKLYIYSLYIYSLYIYLLYIYSLYIY